jgi:nitrite reductase/ring-hydroxylating ferredoxin subunit
MSTETPTSLAPSLRLCWLDEIENGQSLRVDLDGHTPFAVFRVDGGYFVIDDTCTHGNASLSEGLVEGEQVECPWHSSRFCLRTGAALNFPAQAPVRVYPAHVKDGELYIKTPAVPT